MLTLWDLSLVQDPPPPHCPPVHGHVTVVNNTDAAQCAREHGQHVVDLFLLGEFLDLNNTKQR